MAGAATANAMIMTQPRKTRPTAYLIKTSEVINEGDLVGLDTSGLIVAASKTQSAIVKALGLAFFQDRNGTGVTRTGDGVLTCSIAEGARLLNANSTLVPSLGKGLPVYLGPVPTSTVSNYTCALTSTDGDAEQQVGYVDSDGTTLVIDVPQVSLLKHQTAGNSVITAA